MRNINYYFVLIMMCTGILSCSDKTPAVNATPTSTPTINTESNEPQIGKFQSIYKSFSGLSVNVKIEEKNLILGVGEKYNLSVKQTYSDMENDYDKAVDWFSLDNSTASVDKFGKVTGLKEGKVTIKASSKFKPEISDQTTITIDKNKLFNNQKTITKNEGKIYFETNSANDSNSTVHFLYDAYSLKILSNIIYPEVAPNGEKIIGKSGNQLLNIQNGRPNYNEIRKRHLILENNDKSLMVRLTRDRIGSQVYYNDIATWSYDSSKIVSTCNLYNNIEVSNKQLCIINTYDYTISQITDDDNNKEFPLYSPTENKIIFLISGNIYIINTDGTNKKQLTFNKNIKYEMPLSYMNFRQYMNWSPDGKNIAYISGDGTNGRLYIIDSNGQNEIKVSEDLGNINSFQWSPDGSKLLVLSNIPSLPTKYSNNNSLFILDKNGNLLNKFYDNNEISYLNSEWSFDSNSILVLLSSDNSLINGLHIISSDGKNDKKIEPYLPNMDISYIREAHWSPNNTKIVISASFIKMGEEFNIYTKAYIMSSDGTNLTKLDNNSGSDDFEEYTKWFK